MIADFLLALLGLGIAALGVRGLFTLDSQYFHHTLRASQFGQKPSRRWWFLLVNGAVSVGMVLLGVSLAVALALAS